MQLWRGLWKFNSFPLNGWWKSISTTQFWKMNLDKWTNPNIYLSNLAQIKRYSLFPPDQPFFLGISLPSILCVMLLFCYLQLEIRNMIHRAHNSVSMHKHSVKHLESFDVIYTENRYTARWTLWWFHCVSVWCMSVCVCYWILSKFQ